jgi:DNA-directed RNA polymerase specialized sigma24 family protein
MSDLSPPSSRSTLTCPPGGPPSSRSRRHAAGRRLARALLSLEKERAKLARQIGKRAPAGEVPELLSRVVTRALGSRSPPDEEKACRRWLRGVARNVIADHHDGLRREGEAGGEIAGRGEGRIDEEAIGIRLWLEKQVRLGRLTAHELDALLRHAGGEPLDDIAASQGVALPALTQRLGRRRAELRRAWTDDNDDR